MAQEEFQNKYYEKEVISLVGYCGTVIGNSYFVTASLLKEHAVGMDCNVLALWPIGS